MSATMVSSEQRVEAEKTAPANLEEAVLVESKEEDYPHGLQLAFVVLGILLCLFLVSRDRLVCTLNWCRGVSGDAANRLITGSP